MPNHFHLLVYVKVEDDVAFTHQMTLSHVHTLENIGIVNGNARVSGSSTQSRTPTNNNLNNSIGIMLASYTRAIHKQENISGSVFRDKTKAICLTKAEKITPSYYNSTFGTYLNISIPEREYPQLCFDYIHNNPVRANLVKHAKDWEFSSYKDYSGLRNGKLINKERASEFGLINGSDTHQMTSI